jgi:hypothetical protein
MFQSTATKECNTRVCCVGNSGHRNFLLWELSRKLQRRQQREANEWTLYLLFTKRCKNGYTFPNVVVNRKLQC